MSDSVVVVKAKPSRKVFKATKQNKIPADFLENPELKKASEALPSNYNFEIPKTIYRIKETNAKNVALQMPEGLQMFATTIVDIIRKFTSADCLIMGDVTYGACCIDDFTANLLDIDLLIHYGHSCLVPLRQNEDKGNCKILYIFVDIKIDPVHFIETVKQNIPRNERIGLCSTIQFVTTLQMVAEELRKFDYKVSVPQFKPLSPGEILGCTAPYLQCTDIIIYLGDGRFHLESIMIANPKLKAYRYDPYEKRFSQEFYDHERMLQDRFGAIDLCKNENSFGVIIGTLGRQGSVKVADTLIRSLKEKGKRTSVLLMSEIFPKKLQLFKNIDAFVQNACPRLSIDWGISFPKPLLNPYELSVALNAVKWVAKDSSIENYPMDYYGNASLGPWTPNHIETEEKNKCCEKCKC